ncbi:single-stranded-DNA-specific exonuclease RecJ [Flavobacterium sp. CYK-55]|uniref:single-stranded-DNA-specific exonuclease RecJ n=1 Tax=Flavobacterium sp. CYK-55 TaxID=2835529 RepID=UPI001BCB6F0C|nr:single-stranded-DNA-specific exonuclease RecJ [Flavobacterium sp. CYK-55]MBS7785993.1 single-stranded-DNA-specific exonuclease RecJ [Flavobacterium sp. CYK-55]
MRWTLQNPPEPKQIEALKSALNVDTITATLLLQRGIQTYEQARVFFRPDWSDLHDPFLMKDMDLAVARMERAIESGENILVFGDYDVDGTTAVALMSSYLKTRTTLVDTYIPDRYAEGYGISYQGIDYADDNDCSLIIALDCGIKSIDHVAYAAERNIDFIICDHHKPGAEIPKAVAVLNPKREDCTYPYDELCGCGVGFKLVQALAQQQGESVQELRPYLDLVATAIAADIVPMTDENRILAKLGLEVINSHPRPGIKAMTQNLKKKKLTITDVVFVIAPRINAAGRIKHGNEAVALLTEYDIDQAEFFASEIEKHNADRKELDQQITAEALLQIEQNQEQDKYTSVVYNPNWHKGVIGIVASRLTETYYRPTIVFTQSGDKLAASARSVKDFDLYQALEACSAHLEQFGGHMYAAGMTLLEENYEAFKEAFESEVQKTILPEMREPEIEVDLEINLDEITPKLFRILQQFEPFGPQNRTPVFLSRSLTDSGQAKKIGRDESHLRMFVKQNGSPAFGAVGFGLGEKLPLTENKQPFQAVYCIDENEFNGQVSLQLRIKDIKHEE